MKIKFCKCAEKTIEEQMCELNYRTHVSRLTCVTCYTLLGIVYCPRGTICIPSKNVYGNGKEFLREDAPIGARVIMACRYFCVEHVKTLLASMNEAEFIEMYRMDGGCLFICGDWALTLKRAMSGFTDVELPDLFFKMNRALINTSFRFTPMSCEVLDARVSYEGMSGLHMDFNILLNGKLKFYARKIKMKIPGMKINIIEIEGSNLQSFFVKLGHMECNDKYIHFSFLGKDSEKVHEYQIKIPSLASFGDMTECNICMEKVTYGCGYIPWCGHLFHVNCMKQWKNGKNKNNFHCPVCKSSIETTVL